MYDNPIGDIPDNLIISAEQVFDNLMNAGSLLRIVYLFDINHENHKIISISSEYNDLCRQTEECIFIAGKAAYQEGNYELAKYWWHDVRIKPILYILGDKISDNNTNEIGIQYYDFIGEIFPNDQAIYEKKIYIYSYFGKWDDALKELEIARGINPDNQNINCLYGAALVYTKTNPREGIDLCILAITNEPDNLWLYERLSRMYMNLGEPDLARKWVEIALNRFPNREEPLNWLHNTND